MLANHRQGWGFVAVPKNASTAIEAMLRPHASIALTHPEDPALKHLGFRGVERHVLPLIRQVRGAPPHFFAVVRHPVDYAYSQYRMRTEPRFADPSYPFHKYWAGDMTFEAFAEAAAERPRREVAEFQSQRWMVETGEGGIGVQTILKFERLGETLLPFLARFGLELPPEAFARLNVSPPPCDRDVSARARAAVARIPRYADDLALWEAAS